LPGEIEEISSTSCRLTLSRKVPVGAAIKIDDGERILLAEVVHAESVGQEHTLQLRIEHSLATKSASSWFGLKSSYDSGNGTAVELEDDRSLDGIGAAVWAELQLIPSLFGRLLHISLLPARDGRGAKERSRNSAAGLAPVLNTIHEQLFNEWLSLSLLAQKADLDSYFSSLQGHRRQVVSEWTRVAPFSKCIPPGARPAERRLFIADLDALLTVIASEHDTTKSSALADLAPTSVRA
jgi:hypothetical protein